MKKGRDMTNYDNLSKITGTEEPVHIEAVKMLLTQIHEDYERDLFERNYSTYLGRYKAMAEWLNSEIKR